MSEERRRYPDVSEILAAKAAWRRERAKLTFAEKLDIVDALRARVEPIIRTRELRKKPKRT